MLHSCVQYHFMSETSPPSISCAHCVKYSNAGGFQLFILSLFTFFDFMHTSWLWALHWFYEAGTEKISNKYVFHCDKLGQHIRTTYKNTKQNKTHPLLSANLFDDTMLFTGHRAFNLCCRHGSDAGSSQWLTKEVETGGMCALLPVRWLNCCVPMGTVIFFYFLALALSFIHLPAFHLHQLFFPCYIVDMWFISTFQGHQMERLAR